MFSLIITIISIALVAALAIATIYYGGSAFTQGSAKSQASTLTAQAQQIMGAVVLYKNDSGPTITAGDTVAAWNTAAPTYLQSAPSVSATVSGTGVWTFRGTNATSVDIPVISVDVCKQVNKSIGIVDAAGEGKVATALEVANSQYYCVEGTSPGTCTATATEECTFVYKG